MVVIPLILAIALAHCGAIFPYHSPHGNDSVLFALSPNLGFWKHMKPVIYKWNYYPQFATAAHPYDK
jgi:hypothetical protein